MKQPPRENGASVMSDRSTNNVSPVLLEHYLQQHASLVTEDIERKLSRDDCCKYCDVYADNRLTHGKQKQILAWTDEVNSNMANEQRISMDKINSSKDTAKPKLKFLKNIPIGKPDTEKGFRRVRLLSASFRHSKPNGASTNVVRRKSFTDKTSKRKTERAQQFHESKLDSSDINNTQTETHELIPDEHSKSISARKPHSARSTATSTDLSSTFSQTPSQISSVKSTQLGSRTTSNNLLNCISIDDSFRQHRGILANTSPWLGAKCVEEEQVQTLEDYDNIVDDDVVNNRLPNGTDIPISSDNKPNYTKTTTSASNKAVFTGFDALEATNEATHTCAYKGLYKFDKSCGQPLNDSKGTKRFQKLHKNLHKMVEDFHLHGSSLSSKMRRWKDGEDVRSDVSSFGGSSSTYSISRPQSGHSGISNSNGPNKAVRFKTRSGTASSKKLSANSKSRNQNHAEQSGLNGQTVLGDDGRESFLEMIMDMDQQKNGGQGNVQIQTYVYV